MSNFHKLIVVCSIATFIGIFQLHFAYYILLKVIFFGSLLYFAFEYQNKSKLTSAILVTLIVLIVLYNPIFLVQLDSKPLWIIINIATIGFLYWLSTNLYATNETIQAKEACIKYYISGFVFTGHGEGDRVKIIEIYNSLATAEEKLEALIKDKQSQGWEIESLPYDEITSDDNNLIGMAVANMPDSINSVTWTLTTDPEPISNGQVVFSEFVDVTEDAQQNTIANRETVFGEIIGLFREYPVAFPVLIGVIIFIFT